MIFSLVFFSHKHKTLLLRYLDFITDIIFSEENSKQKRRFGTCWQYATNTPKYCFIASITTKCVFLLKTTILCGGSHNFGTFFKRIKKSTYKYQAGCLTLKSLQKVTRFYTFLSFENTHKMKMSQIMAEKKKKLYLKRRTQQYINILLFAYCYLFSTLIQLSMMICFLKIPGSSRQRPAHPLGGVIHKHTLDNHKNETNSLCCKYQRMSFGEGWIACACVDALMQYAKQWLTCHAEKSLR